MGVSVMDVLVGIDCPLFTVHYTYLHWGRLRHSEVRWGLT